MHCDDLTYKISNELLEIESFHSRSERTLKQELYAHFTLIAMARLFASRCERQFESRVKEAGRPPLRANFNHSLGAVERELEGLLLQQAPAAAGHPEPGAGARGAGSAAGAARPLLPAPVPPPQ